MSIEPPQAEAPSGSLSIRRALQLAVLLLAGFYAGTPASDVTWVQGDEYLFIVNNPDVVGGTGSGVLLERLVGIFGKVHGDLYQPLPIASYAIEYAVWGPQNVAYYVRVTDLLLHLLNGLLVWCVLQQIFRWRDDTAGVGWVAWGLALIWTVHPALTRAYAADMGRTHVLSATFGLLALAWLVRYAEKSRLQDGVAALVTLLLAMLAKPVVGWFVVAGLLVWHRQGLIGMLRSWLVWASLALCALFAVVTMRTSGDAGLLENVGASLFGDPVTRSLLASFIYVRDSFWPVDLPIWYIPDVQTGWGYGPVLVGVVIVTISLVLMLATLFRNNTRLFATGMVWYWLYLLPVLGLVGARFSAAGDRYLYQPLVGLLLALGIVLLSVLRSASLRTGAGVVLGLLGLVMIPEATRLADVARSMEQRGDDVVRRNPEDPRAFEMHGAAYSFLTDHPEAGAGESAQGEYAALAISSLERAGELAQEDAWFRTPETQAEFFRRVSENLQKLGANASSQQMAGAAFSLTKSAAICTRLAHASQIVQDYPTALGAYEALRQSLPEDLDLRIRRLTEHADLLLLVFEDPVRAMPIYRQAADIGPVPDRAKVGLARCEVLVGDGAEGFRLASEVAEAEPTRSDAPLVQALYYLRSGKVPEAARTYGKLLARDPTNYEGLRGFQEVAGQTGRFDDAVKAWEFALERQPANQPFRSYYAWALALARDERLLPMVQMNLNAVENDRFSCLSLMLHEAWAGRWENALRWIERAPLGESQPRARELARAELSLRLLIERELLPGEGHLLRAALWRLRENDAAFEEALQQAQAAELDLAGLALLQRLRAGAIGGEATMPTGD